MRSLLLFAALALTPVFAHASPPLSEQASEASLISLFRPGQVSEAAWDALAAGGHFVVKSVKASGEGVSIVVEKVGDGVSFVANTSAETAASTGIAVSATVVVSAVAGGYLLSHDGKPFAFIASPRTREMIHSKEIG